MKNVESESRAAERFQIIAPLLDKSLDKNAEVALRKAIAKQYGIDERTLRRWVNSYKDDGFSGLMPAQRTETAGKVITDEILNAAIQLRRELPKRSVKNIIKGLEAQGLVPEGAIKRSTLQDALATAGYSSAQMRSYEPDVEARYARRFQKEHRNECWQADIKYGPALGGQRTYLFSVIDDATRFICHSEFFPRQDLEATMTAMRKAFVHAGLPQLLYLDNGKVFRSNQMQHMAARLGIRLTYIKPYTPRGHGKIERYNRTVEGFLMEAGLEDFKDLESLNRMYQAWVDDCYQREVHSALDGLTPKEAFERDPEEIRWATDEELHDAFLRVESRKVNKSGCISLGNEEWEVEIGALLVGRKVQVLIDPADPAEVGIECEGFPPSKARRLIIGPHTGRRPKIVPPNGKPEGSVLLQSALQRYDERQAQEQLQAERPQESAAAAPESSEKSPETERTEILRFSSLRKDRK